MNFRFNVNLTDEDYMEFNKFHLLRSTYGKKQMRTFRVLITAICFLFSFIIMFANSFDPAALFGVIPFLFVWVVAQLTLRALMVFSIKSTLRSLKKTGKAAYSPSSVLEFGEESITEITELAKTEQKYKSIESISLVDNKMIYIHLNSIMAYILPLAAFESKEQYEAFMEFIRTKCNIINVY